MDELFFSYVPGNSPIHRLDPRTKIIAVMALSILIFRAQTIHQIGLFTLLFVSISLISGIGPFMNLRAIRPLAIFFGLIFVMQIFLTPGEALFSAGPLSPTFEGLEQGVLVTARFILLILFASLLTTTTNSTMITCGIERMLRPLPLKALGITSFEIATMMSLSIRFIPTIFENANQIRNAQISRGLDIRHGLKRSVASISIPLIAGSIRAAEELAVAMESRCYQGNFRTSLFELKMRRIDWALVTVISISTMLLIFAPNLNI